MPKGATPVDFAYKIHTEVGNSMVDAIVNGISVPVNYKLQDKDRIVIVTDTLSKGPDIEWIKFAKTSHARRRIKENSKK